MILSSLKNRLRSRTRVANVMIKYVLETRLRACIQRAVICIHKLKRKTLIRNRAKSGSGAPGPESAPRGATSTIFAKGMFQPFDLLKFFLNSAREQSFSLLNVRYTYNTKLKLEKSSESEVGLF